MNYLYIFPLMPTLTWPVAVMLIIPHRLTVASQLSRCVSCHPVGEGFHPAMYSITTSEDNFESFHKHTVSPEANFSEH